MKKMYGRHTRHRTQKYVRTYCRGVPAFGDDWRDLDQISGKSQKNIISTQNYGFRDSNLRIQLQILLKSGRGSGI